MTKIIAIVNQKGGVGKTTSTINIGAGLARNRKRVLLVDFDPQGSMTISLGIDAKSLKYTMFDVMTGECEAKEAINKLSNCDLIATDQRLTIAEKNISDQTGREYVLKEALQPIMNEYDYILIDNTPSLGLLTINALTACNEVYIPTQAEYLAMSGIVELKKTIETIKKYTNKKIAVTGVIVTMYDNRKNLHKDIVAKLEEAFPQKVFNTKIRNNVAIAEAPINGVDIFEYDPKSNGAIDYNGIVSEILGRETKQNGK